jgi:hypothetical protein
MIQKQIIVAAFQRGWRTLLREERVTCHNIEKIAASLLCGIFDAAQGGEQDEIALMTRSLENARGQDGAPTAGAAAPDHTRLH